MRSVAVLPIRNLTGESSLDQSADKLTEDANYVIGRGGYDQVPPRSAIFAFKGKAADARNVGRALRVRYLATASLRKAPPGYRVSLEIVDTETGTVVDSEEFGRGATDGALPEDALALVLFTKVASRLDALWETYELSKRPDDSDVQNVLARLLKMQQDDRPQDIAGFEHLVGRARALLAKDDPLLANVYGQACSFYADMVDAELGSSAQRAAWARSALDYGAQETELRPSSSRAYACRSEVFSDLGRWDEAMAEARHIIQVFPLTAQGYEALGLAEFAQGRFADALQD